MDAAAAAAEAAAAAAAEAAAAAPKKRRKPKGNHQPQQAETNAPPTIPGKQNPAKTFDVVIKGRPPKPIKLLGKS